MLANKVTNLNDYKMLRQSPAVAYFRLNETIQQIVLRWVTWPFAAHRDYLRMFIK